MQADLYTLPGLSGVVRTWEFCPNVDFCTKGTGRREVAFLKGGREGARLSTGRIAHEAREPDEFALHCSEPMLSISTRFDHQSE